MKERRTERSMMIKEEAAEDISGGGGRGLSRRTVVASHRRMKEDAKHTRARERMAEIEERGAKQRGYAEGRGEMRRKGRIEAGCCAVTVH